MPYRVEFLGTPSIKRSAEVITGQLQAKEIGLLAYLAVTRQAVAREKLATLFWGERPEKQAKQSLRKAIHNIGKLMPDLIHANGRFSLSLKAGSIVMVDLWEFESAYTQCQWETAVSLYQGGFLEGLYLKQAPQFEAWYTRQQETYRQLILKVLQKLLEQEEVRQNPDLSLNYSRLMIQLDPLHEMGYRHAMLALARQRQFNDALTLYHQCQKKLFEELGETPTPETSALFERLQTARQAAKTELPADPTRFVGREAELAQIKTHLMDVNCRLLTLLGIGGQGKTRLALESARRYRNLFLHDVAFVPLLESAEASKTAVLNSLARALKLTDTAVPPQQQVINFLRPREMLLIFDNFEHLIDQAPLLSTILRACPHLKMLTTSRVRLDLAEEWIIDVDGLSLPPINLPSEKEGTPFSTNQQRPHDALELFRQCATQLNSSFSLSIHWAAAVTICHFVKGLPLGIELFASWLRSMSITQIVDYLTEEKNATLQAKRHFAPRHQNLQTVFEHSWRLLSPSEQNAFARLAVFPADFSPEAARHVANTSEVVLQNLTNSSMLQRHLDGRYALHPLLRTFAKNKLVNRNEEAATLARHARFFEQFLVARMAATNLDSQTAVLSALEKELPNLHAAWRYAIAQDNVDALSILLEGFGQLYVSRSWYLPGIELFEEAVKRLQTAAKQSLLGRFLLYQGLLHELLGQYVTAKALALDALSRSQAQQDQKYIAKAQLLLGTVYYDQSIYDEAEAWLEKALALARTVCDHETVGDCLRYLGLIFCLQPIFTATSVKRPYMPPAPFFNKHRPPSEQMIKGSQKGRTYFVMAQQAYSQASYTLGEALAIHCQGYTYYTTHNYIEAIACIEEAVAKLRLLDAQSDLTQSLNWIAICWHRHGHFDTAYSYFLEAIETGFKASAFKRLLGTLRNFATLWWEMKQEHFMPLVISDFVAEFPHTDARVRATALDWRGSIQAFMTHAEIEHATRFARQQTLASLVNLILESK